MNTSETTAALIGALIAAQLEYPQFPRDRQVKVKTKSGAEYTFNYAPLDSILDKVRPALLKNGITFTQFTDGHHLLTRIMHSSGEWMESGQMPLIAAGNDPQSFGSAITYAKRYALCAMLGIVSEDDDDGNRAAGNESKGKAKGARGTLQDEFNALTPEVQEALRRKIADVIALVDEGRVEEAVSICEKLDDDTEKNAAWYLLNSKQRSTIKTYQENMRKRAEKGG